MEFVTLKVFMTMEKTQAHIRIQGLRDILNEANRKYYIENSPSISDFEFDMLMKELEGLEKEYPELVTSDSPTQNVGSDIVRGTVFPNETQTLKKEFEQYPNRYPMLSLAKT